MKISTNYIKIGTIVAFIVSFILLKYNSTFRQFVPCTALVSGIILSSIHNDKVITDYCSLWSRKILVYAIVLLGFGFNLHNILKAGIEGFGYTIISIGLTFVIGLTLGHILKANGKMAVLISAGTAVCGSSAIVALAPIIRARQEQIAISIGTIFLLNAIGLILFPPIGHYFHFSQKQFGLLSALAIHDTSSVIGSCIAYGPVALIVGTTVKLVRAIWIIPICVVTAFIYNKINKEERLESSKNPWFIIWFILASLTATLLPKFQLFFAFLKGIGETLFVVALFLIGYSVNFKMLKNIGVKVLIYASTLWITVCSLVIAALNLKLLS